VSAPLPKRSAPVTRIGIPSSDLLEFFGDSEAAALFARAVAKLAEAGATIVEIDYAPFRDAARLLYSGPWVAERYAAIEPFFAKQSSAMDATVRTIISGATKYSAVDTFRATYELERLRKLADREWEKMDVMLLPTTGTTYKVDEVLADPIQLNTNLGYYTNFVNLLDLCGLAVPAGFRESNGLPFGVTFMAPAFEESRLSAIARSFIGEAPDPRRHAGKIQIAVVGAHLSGQPLNHQLTSRGGALVRTCQTSPGYRLYSLANTTPPKPGLVRSPGFTGPGIQLEVWALTPEAFGEFVVEVPQPMTIGTVDLEDGTKVKGFTCEPCVVGGALEITQFGGWRAFLASP
jgi:allophanate hydrolase